MENINKILTSEELYDKIIFLVEETKADNSTDLVEFINSINCLLCLRDFYTLNLIFKNVKIKNAIPVILIILIRTVYAVRSLLVDWQPFVDSVEVEFKNRNLNERTLLQGLLK